MPALDRETAYQWLTEMLIETERVIERCASRLSLAKTPREAILVHVTCYTAALYVIDFTCALDFGEAQPDMAGSRTPCT